jgi:CDP-diacylglycerol--glycerol-3-phosphate 3-phosphatidyltransferase
VLWNPSLYSRDQDARASARPGDADPPAPEPNKKLTFTGAIGIICMFPLRAVIRVSVALGISPNTLTLIGVLINCTAALGLAINQFVLSGLIMICANIFDFIDGKVAHITGRQSEFGAFWDSTLDRFSDLALFTGLIWLYARLGRNDYVLITT